MPVVDTLYVLASLPRTGSGLMVDIFNNAGIPSREIYPSDKSAVTLGDKLRTTGSVIGIKPILQHFVDRELSPDLWLDKLITRIATKNIIWVHMDRYDKHRQAMSYERAVILKEWQTFDTAKSYAGNLPPDIHERMAWMQYEQLWWSAYFGARGINPHRLYYEDWTKDKGTIFMTAEKLLNLTNHSWDWSGKTRRKQSGQDTEKHIQSMYKNTLAQEAIHNAV